ncbi:hypothetical protein DFH08DRAFT_1089798 [Mycena albidolilacea]|uniref:Uncharacterized protein n=1 Tax=Mycena albidolilacea TaxID=1033008 RepID=A0AAD6YZZ2_9AGAR|nr:hypothetical protein DFH08DRAFT_1089798 [Mycena albidolilacea]
MPPCIGPDPGVSQLAVAVGSAFPRKRPPEYPVSAYIPVLLNFTAATAKPPATLFPAGTDPYPPKVPPFFASTSIKRRPEEEVRLLARYTANNTATAYGYGDEVIKAWEILHISLKTGSTFASLHLSTLARLPLLSPQPSLSAVRPPHFLPLRCVVSPPPTFVSVAISLSRATAIPVTVQDSNVDNVARAPAPDPDPACRMYACI